VTNSTDQIILKILRKKIILLIFFFSHTQKWEKLIQVAKVVSEV